jgi:hypothetical protein
VNSFNAAQRKLDRLSILVNYLTNKEDQQDSDAERSR